MNPLKIGNLIASVPIVQGGMGVGVSLGGLAGAVAKAGGVGIISTAQIGFREPDFETNQVEANRRAIKKEFDKARAIAPNGIIGFNIMVALKEFKSHVQAAVEAGADLIISGAGLPTALPEIVRECMMKQGPQSETGSDKGKTKLAPIVSSDKSAKVILKYWDKKYQIVPDMVVIEGPKAGGHLGFSKEQLATYTRDIYDEEIKAILATVKEYGDKYDCQIPVVVAGGISDAKEMQHALSLGAQGVQVASRFVTTEECDADIRYKEAYVNAKKEDIAIVTSPVGMPGRAILNDFMKRVMLGEKIPHTPCHLCLAKCKPAEIPYCITDGLINAAKGNVEEALLFCGADAYKQNKIETVPEVIASFMEA